MNTLLLLIICIAVLLTGYILYGGWLCKQWGVGENKEETPAHTLEDGVDYVPAIIFPPSQEQVLSPARSVPPCLVGFP